MANVDEEARKNGVRFRHYYSYSNKHIATIATRISEYGNQIVDVGVAFCSVKDEPDKIKAKTIAMGRVLQGSKKFMTSFDLSILRGRIKDNSILDVFVPVMHPSFKKMYVQNNMLRLRDRLMPPLFWEEMKDTPCDCEECNCGY